MIKPFNRGEWGILIEDKNRENQNWKPVLWEEGGRFKYYGSSRVITTEMREPSKACYIKTRGTIANEVHTLRSVKVKFYVRELPAANCG